MELRPRGVTVYFSLTLGDRQAEVHLTYVSFDETGADPDLNSALLRDALADARLTPRHRAAAAA